MDWKDTLPDELKNDASLKDIKDVASLAKSFIETKTYVGQSIRIPSAEAGADARKEFVTKLQERVPELVLVPEDEAKRAEVEETIFAKLGKPKDAKGYEVPKLDDVALSPEEEETLRGIATRRGYTKKQFSALVKDAAAEKLARQKAQHEARNQLKQTFGSAYDERLGVFRALAEQTGAPDGLKKAIADGTIDPASAKWMEGLARKMGLLDAGSGGIGNQGGGGNGKMTPAEAQLKLAEIRSNPVYFNRGKNPELHEALKAKVQELLPLAYPEDAAKSPVRIP
jgi:hypothetical protein